MFDVLQQTRAVSTCKLCLSAATTILNEYIPTFRFGVLSTCRAVTISINPAENQQGYRPLPQLRQYRIADRSALTDDDLTDVVRRSDEYFAVGNKHKFFNTLARLVSNIDSTWTYEAGTLSHIDVVACVTRPTWADVPAQERQVMLERCREHFLNTLKFLPSDCWLLCDGKTVLEAIKQVGGQAEKTERVGHRQTVCVGNLLLEGRTHRFIGWNIPAHQPYGSQPTLGAAVKELMDGGGHDPKAAVALRPSLDSPLMSSCIADGLSFTSQRDLMRFLVGRLGYNENAVCREYAAAERRGLVPRRSDKYQLPPEKYAHRLYSDGIRKPWL